MTFPLMRSLGAVCCFAALFSVVDGESITTEYMHYASPQGTNYFAVGLQAPAATQPKANETVFLIDTSASQLGQARLDTLEAVTTAIGNLPKGTQVQIFTMDVKTEPLTAGFVASDSSEVGKALKTLSKRIPLGATDFGKGLQTVRTAFEGRSREANRSVLYLGDGRSMAKTLPIENFKKEAAQFADKRIAFTACSVGVETNFGIIAALANQTGGNLVELSPAGEDDKSAKAAGSKLAESATATVVWVDAASVKFPEGFTVYPQKIQPIRSDRATIVVGKTEVSALPAFDLKLQGHTSDAAVALDYNAKPQAAQNGNNFLRTIVETAAKDGGATMPITGWESLTVMHEFFIAGIANQISKASAAIEASNPQKALLVLNDVLRADPNNKQAQGLFERAEKLQTASVTPVPAIPYQAVRDEVKSEESGASIAANDAPAQVDAVIKSHGTAVQKVHNEVRHAINDSATRANKDPEAAIQGLKLMQQIIRSNADLAPAERDALVDRLGNTLKQIESEKFTQEFRQVQVEANTAKQRARQEAVQETQKVREQAVQIFNRLDSLLDAKEYKAAVAVAEAGTELLQAMNLPEVTVGHAGRRAAQMMHYVEEYEKLRYQRHIGFIDSFMEAEKSFIPVPDEPPISYIDRDRWLLLTDYRRKKYSSVTLSDPDDFTKKASKVLDRRDIRLNIDDTTTFDDVIKQIRSQLGTEKIEIGLDTAALKEADEIHGDTPILAASGETRFDHPGMRLRNALSRLLAPNEMTIMVKDEMLLFTTLEAAQDPKNMQIRVYPVGDIIFAGGGSVSGGMMGGMGGYGGGMMGGMGGYGGGMMGGMGGYGGGMMGGMGGYGGGMYSVPDEIKRSTSSKAKLLLDESTTSKYPAKFWADYFTSGKVDMAVVQEVVKRLANRQKQKQQVEEQVIAIVEQALLSGYGEQWMYEALTLSLYLKDAPKTEILRAALSMADFCSDPIDLMTLGSLMRTTLGLKRESFPLYQQALIMLPLKREFYLSTLRLAEELYNDHDDPEPAKWIGLAILSQEWDGVSGAVLVQKASDILSALQNKMRNTDRSAEADELAAAVKEAQERDCIVTVEWTGDANLDLMVREPSDTYCWFLNPRSMSGGLLKTTVNVSGNRTAPVKKLVYVCPRGFNGTYTLLLQKEWGTVANNLVKVSIEKRAEGVTSEREIDSKAFPLTHGGVFMNFQLASGRRTDSAGEAELQEADLQASFAQQVVQRNRMLRLLGNDGVLAQTTNTSTNTTGTSTSTNSTSSRRGNNNSTNTNSTDNTNNTSTVSSPFDVVVSERAKIGYQPEISLISEGPSLMAEAVVTPDRCYVLMRPYFSPNGGGGGMGGYGGGGYGGNSGGYGGYGGGYGGNSGYGGGYGGNSSYGGGYGSY